MKQTLIILTIFFLGCSDRQNSGQTKDIKLDTVKTKTICVKQDSIINHTCLFQDLSSLYDYQVNFMRFVNIDGIHDSCVVKVIIFDKKVNRKVDSLTLNSIFYYDNFKNCDNIRSYITGKNKNKEVADNDYGDLIIADFNFDSKEDIAIVNECSNSGQLYNFYVQDISGKFRLDSFLTDSMAYFPSEINIENKTLVTYIVGGVCWVGEHTYQLDMKKSKWRQISHKSINICEENKE